MKVDGATRAGRPKGQGLASSSWLLVLAGISCTYPVELPGVLVDAGRNTGGTGGLAGSDASVDQLSSNDRPWFYGCPNPKPVNITKASNTVEMIIALDRSTSMQQHAFDSKQAILDAIKKHPGIKFSLEQFPWSRDCNNGAACCASQVSFSPAPNQSTSIATQLGCGPGDAGCPPTGDDSPSHLALRQCGDFFAGDGSQWAFSRFVLLMTDRDPTCGGDVFPGPCSEATDEAAKLGAPGVSVQIFVVALNSDGASVDCLNKIAAANAYSIGGSDQQFFSATDQTELGQRLGDIMTLAEKPLCEFLLHAPYDNPDQLEVTVNGQSVGYDPGGQNGWKLSDPYTLVLSGSSCTGVKAGQTVTVAACSS